MKNIKKISSELHKRLFGTDRITPPFTYENVADRALKQFGLDTAVDPTPDGELPLPDWFPTATEFFDQAADDYLEPYKQLLAQLSSWDGGVAYPLNYDGLKPGHWALWKGRYWEQVQLPPGASSYCLDFETVQVVEGEAWLPVCCVALRVIGPSSELYVWVQDFNRPVTVVPFSRDNVITGWNVCGYDRQFLATEYSFKPSGNVFPDLMAMHIKTRGVSNQQIPLLAMANRAMNGDGEDGDYVPQWAFESSGNSLAAVYKLWFTGQSLDKGVRDEIVKLGLPWVRDNIARVVQYCIEDVYHTLQLWDCIYPEYSGYPNEQIMENSHNPSKVSIAGHLLASTGFVPLSPSRWPTYYEKAEQRYQYVLSEVAVAILELAKDIVREHWSVSGLKQTVLDPWEVQLDWTPVKPKGKKDKLPKWYHSLASKPITVNKRVVPLVLKMRWMGEPIAYSAGKGWHTAKERIPHPEDTKQPLTHIFAKANKTALTNGQFSGALENLQHVIDLVNSIIIWKSMRKRVKALKVELMQDTPAGSPQTPMLVPNIIQHGTISGRQASKDIHVFSHPKPASVGSSFLALIEALPGYSEVTIDFDSQELKLVAYAGCEALGFIGSTPLSVMVEIGQAKDKTDFHSMNMALMGITNRTLVKNCGYAWCYMCGHETQVKTILKGNPELGEARAREIELKGRAGFVGVKVGGQFSGGSASDSFNVLTRRANANPITTLLGGVKLTKALSGNKDYLTTRFNAVIQATGAAMLDHILVGTTYMAKRYNIDTRYMLSRHDEWCYHTKNEDIMNIAWVMQTVHLAVWAKLMYEMGLDTVSLNCAYASSVSVLKNYQKSPNSVTITPEQPPVHPGYSIYKEDILEYCTTSSFDSSTQSSGL